MGIALAGLALTAGLTWTASTVNRDSNARLLQLQVKQAAATLTAAVPSIQSELLDCLRVETDTGDVAAFKRFAASKVMPAGTFASISLWKRTATGAVQLGLVGDRPQLVSDGDSAAFLAHIHPNALLEVTKALPGSPPRLGYAEMPPGDTSYIVYAESLLPKQHKLTVPKSSAFDDLNFAIYFGTHASQTQLIEASVPTPIKGLKASASVPLGDSFLTLVATPTEQLAGNLSAALPWVVIGIGCALSLATAATVEYVLRRRRVAEELAAENERLYMEQRNIAGTLQHALLPALPALGSVEIGARYLPGVAGIDVGGDWFDVIPIDEWRCVFVVGDVSGRGLGAATTMASLRFSTRAYVAQGDDPATVLRKLGDMLDFDSSQRFATVLIGELDTRTHRLTLANAGHLPPLLVNGDEAHFISVPSGTPVGISGPERPRTVSVDVNHGSLLLAFTDGLVERRGEHLQEGLERLRRAAIRQTGPVETILDRLASQLIPSGAGDDMVILGMRWQS